MSQGELQSVQPALFREFPRLSASLPYTSLGTFPTPVQLLPKLAAELGAGSLYIKHDGHSSPLYGGNKVRKLEFLLGDAMRQGAKVVLTGGFAGSNHAVATAIHARHLGIDSILFFADQTNAHYVRANLLRGFDAGAEQRLWMGPLSRMAEMWEEMRELGESLTNEGRKACLVPAGGTSALGTVGYVNAVFELREQVRQGMLPEPELIYVASGTQGTSIGLQLGVMAAGLKSRVVAVRVVDPAWSNGRRGLRLFRETVELLRSADPAFPDLQATEQELQPVGDFYGTQYAVFTEAGMNAVHRLQELEGIKLEGTYTGKTLSAVFAAGRAGGLQGKNVLFWNTYNSVPLPPEVEAIDYRRLPRGFHHYFEEPVQELDR